MSPVSSEICTMLFNPVVFVDRWVDDSRVVADLIPTTVLEREATTTPAVSCICARYSRDSTALIKVFVCSHRDIRLLDEYSPARIEIFDRG